MGIIIEKASILCSAFTIAALWFGLEPFQAFAVGVLLFMPIRMLLGGKIVSQTGMAASFGAVIAFSYFGVTLLHSFLVGVLLGYSYLYSWLFVMPRILK